MESKILVGPMTGREERGDRVGQWLEGLEKRHFADLTRPEVGRALRALSSCYVERRGRLAEGGALSGAGKRAAFALFYGPLHFLVVDHIVRGLPSASDTISQVYDLGCGTGAAGAAWALQRTGVRIAGVDRHPWAVSEANWTYGMLGLTGRAAQGDLARARLGGGRGTAILAAYAMNELPAPARQGMLVRLLEAAAAGTAVLIVEPIARRMSPWWAEWSRAFLEAGGRADEWRFPSTLPPPQRDLARAAGLRPHELTARSLFARGTGRS